MEQRAVLLVEDEVLIRRHLGVMMRKMGYTVAGETGTGEEAVKLARSLKPDLIVMDIRLAGSISGIEAADEICRACCPDCAPCIIFASAYDFEGDVPARLADCTVRYLHKPVTRRALDLALAG
ncbi:MAG: response regulator [Spirochaetota bacterium]